MTKRVSADRVGDVVGVSKVVAISNDGVVFGGPEGAFTVRIDKAAPQPEITAAARGDELPPVEPTPFRGAVPPSEPLMSGRPTAVLPEIQP